MTNVFALLPELLLPWYDCHARVLPWRENTDPYRVWVSEIMLQQTRVEAVLPYYERFLAALPDLASLANADDAVLYKLWEGLGYYSRVRNLRAAAQTIIERFGGSFPARYEDILSLTGIGEYTAGAIASIAFEQPTPAVDGNVIRVLARLTEDSRIISDPRLKKDYSQALAAVYPSQRCGDFTQSLMELGATVCLPNGQPKCEDCPLAAHCGAQLHTTQALYPVREEKKQRRREEKTVFLIRCGDRLAVRRREQSGLLAGLWELPNTEGALTSEQAAVWLADQGFTVHQLERTADKKHIFTHVEWHMRTFAVECTDMHDAYRWVTADELQHEIMLPTAFRKTL